MFMQLNLEPPSYSFKSKISNLKVTLKDKYKITGHRNFRINRTLNSKYFLLSDDDHSRVLKAE